MTTVNQSQPTRQVALDIYTASEYLTISELVARLDAAGLTWQQVCRMVGPMPQPTSEICHRCRQVVPCIDCEERLGGRFTR